VAYRYQQSLPRCTICQESKIPAFNSKQQRAAKPVLPDGCHTKRLNGVTKTARLC